MASTAGTVGTARTGESILAYLPISTTREYRKGQAIYGPNDVAASVHVVLKGIVAVSAAREGGADTMLEVFGPGELLGEDALLGEGPCPHGKAFALADVIVMTWDVEALADILRNSPYAGLALLCALVRRNAEYAARIESFSLDSCEGRLAWSLLRLAERLGEPDGDGWVRLTPLTHSFLASYLGASRAAVTLYMNQFRKSEWLTYSRQAIRIQPLGLRQACSRQAASVAETAA